MTGMTRSEDIENMRIKVGITHGDLNGLGYEIIIKALHDQRMLDMITPVVYGQSKVASYHRKALDVEDFIFNLIKHAEAANPRRPNIINCTEEEIKIDIGKSTAVAGEMAFLALEKATADLQSGLLDVLVTAPINKKNIQSKDFSFPGHTEYLSVKFGADDVLMLMVSNNIRVGVVTGHIPLMEVSQHLTMELILKKLVIMDHALKRDFSIPKPRIALMGLNPHAGDNGLLGSEEADIIIPAVEEAFRQGLHVFGPYAADGFFGSSSFTKFDGILAMYHDQGLIPFKALSFDSGVNFTAGLPVVRTSPAHDTAYEIAGKNRASEESMRAAIFLACDIYRNRLRFDELNSDPLPAEDPSAANVDN